MLQHKHLLVRAEINNPPTDPDQITAWFISLIDAIGMKLLMGPYAKYVEVPGNRGLTCVAIIETSHIAMHVWDEGDPSLMQLDVYTCGALDPNIVFAALATFEPNTIEFKYLDREHGLKEVDVK